MSFTRPTLSELDTRIREDFFTRYQPLSNTPRYNILQALGKTNAGIYHLLYGNLVFLSDQLFPDTATGAYLRAHWSDRIKPLLPSFAVGDVVFTGNDGAPIPSGLLMQSDTGVNYSLQGTVSVNGETATGRVKALTAGSSGNRVAGNMLTIISTLPPGIDSEVTVGSDGIGGGTDGENDEEYLARVLNYIQTGSRYGKPGDWRAWALDASIEVTKAFEISNFGNTGALLVQVVSGDQINGVAQVGNLEVIVDYINTVAPPVPFLVKTPTLVPLNPTITLLPAEDTTIAREHITLRLKQYLDAKGKPVAEITSGELENIVVDGIEITSADVLIQGGKKVISALEYPILGGIAWS